MLYLLRYLRFLVVDEADKLLDQQFQEWLPKLLDAVRAAGGQRGVTMEEVIHGQCGDPLLLSVLHPVSREVRWCIANLCLLRSNISTCSQMVYMLIFVAFNCAVSDQSYGW